jgi:uncharacterized protein
MSRRVPDPLRLDVAAFAKEGAALTGVWPVDQLPRLQQSQQPPQDAAAESVEWTARGEARSVAGEATQIWLHLAARTAVWLTCQRCLAPVRVPLEIDTPIRFVRGEAEAEALDAESEFDVLALVPATDLRQLLEDELLLALPLVPRHANCPAPLTAGSAQATPAARAAESPFSVLADLRSRPRE